MDCTLTNIMAKPWPALISRLTGQPISSALVHMCAAGVEPNSITCNTVLSACQRGLRRRLELTPPRCKLGL